MTKLSEVRPLGSNTISFTAVAGENVRAGQPVYVDKITSKVFLAQADIFTKADVVGMVAQDANVGFLATVSPFVTLNDWTLVVGTASLQQGQRYFLGTTPGTLSTSWSNVSGHSVVLVGEAATSSTMNFAFQFPILL